MKRSSFNKSKISIKNTVGECFGIVKNIDTKLLSGIISVIMLLTSFGVITKYYTLGYNVYYGDVNVGVSGSKQEALETYDAAQCDVNECNRDDFTHDLKFVMTIAPISKIMESDLYRGIVKAAEGEEKCYSIVVNGKSVVKVHSYEAAQMAIEIFRSRFNRDDATVYTTYTISSDYGIVTEILSPEDAASKLVEDNALTVVYRDVVENVLPIAYTTEIIEDEMLPEGYEVCYQVGVDGIGIERHITFYENGKKKHDIDPALEVTVEPVAEIIHVGTGKLSGLSKDCLIWPVDGTFSSEFGRRWGRNHNGIDIAADTGTPIYAPASGVVVYSGTRSGYGNYVVIDHGMGYETTYAHMNKRYVAEGSAVKQGDLIGEVGTTGRVTGAHLHFEVLHNGGFVNPMNYIAG